MLYQEAMPICQLLSCANSLLTTVGKYQQSQLPCSKRRISNSLSFSCKRCFYVGCPFCMGAYKLNVVVVIKIGAYIHGVLILCGCLLSQFYGILTHKHNFSLSSCINCTRKIHTSKYTPCFVREQDPWYLVECIKVILYFTVGFH